MFMALFDAVGTTAPHCSCVRIFMSWRRFTTMLLWGSFNAAHHLTEPRLSADLVQMQHD